MYRPSVTRLATVASRLGAGLSEATAGLADLVLPSACAGCAAERVPLAYGVCAGCVTALEALRAYPTAPRPVPAGLPACTTLGAYGGALRGVLLAYKERGRHRLARPLGTLLAVSVARAAIAAGGDPSVPLLVLPVPSTGEAARRRHGDHLARLAAQCVVRLHTAGWQARVVQPLRALPRPDSADLDTPGRAAAAESSLRIRPTRIRQLRRSVTMGGMLLVVDDIITTGATLATVVNRLNEAQVQVSGAAVLAATGLRKSIDRRPGALPPRRYRMGESPRTGSPNEG